MARARSQQSRLYLQGLEVRRERVPSFDAYPFCIPTFRHLRTISFTSPVTFFIGENGTGKSTLLEALAVASGFNAEGGSRNFRFSTRATHSNLHKFLKLSRSVHRPRDGYFLRAESFFNVATHIEELDAIPAPAPPVIDSYGSISLHAQSHGESFMSLLLTRFRGHGLYILDEPEAALSPTRQLALLARLHQLVTHQSQFIVATHSPIVMSYPGARLLLLADEGIRDIEYEKTDHFVVTRKFLNDHRSLVAHLLSEREPPSGPPDPLA